MDNLFQSSRIERSPGTGKTMQFMGQGAKGLGSIMSLSSTPAKPRLSRRFIT